MSEPATDQRMTARYVRLSVFHNMTGIKPNAVHQRIHRGVWLEGFEFVRDPLGQIQMSMEGYYRWVEGRPRVALNPTGTGSR